MKMNFRVATALNDSGLFHKRHATGQHLTLPFICDTLMSRHLFEKSRLLV